MTTLLLQITVRLTLFQLTLLIAIPWISLSMACGQDVPYEFTGKTMGPIDYRVVIHDQVANPSRMHDSIHGRLEQINRLMSTYLPDSDVTRLNRAAANQWIEIDRLTLQVIEASLRLSELTNGAFDITVGPAVNLWQFGPDQGLSEIPTDAEILSLQAIVGYQNLEIRTEPAAIRKLHDQTKIDLSAIAKGFAVDYVAQWLDEQSLANYLVEVGGEVFARGVTPKGEWRIGIEHPNGSSRPVAVVGLSGQAMATSGDYRNFRMVDGIRMSHAIDPQTCRPVMNPVASCSVVTEDCMTADGLATALMVMPYASATQFCADHQIQAILFARKQDSTGELTVYQTDRFPIVQLDRVSLASTSTVGSSIWPAFAGALIVFTLAIAGMAIGAIFNQRPIRGSCGGIAGSAGENNPSGCSLCTQPANECPERKSLGKQESSP